MKTIDEVAAALRRGESVTIREFGTFKVKDVPARTYRNPRAAVDASAPKTVSAPATKRVTFKASKSLL